MELPQVPSPRCIHLQSKAMAVYGEGFEGDPDFQAGLTDCWCVQTARSLGPDGAGVLYVRREHFDRLRPTLLGAGNVYAPGYVAQDALELLPTAARYEPGSKNLIGITGLHASLSLLSEIGPDVIERRVLALARILIDRLRDWGFEILGPLEGPALSGIVSCRRAGADLAALHARLAERRIVASLRDLRDGTRVLRFSPHFYNTEVEIEAALAALP